MNHGYCEGLAPWERELLGYNEANLIVSFNCLGTNVASDPLTPIDAKRFQQELSAKGISSTLTFA